MVSFIIRRLASLIVVLLLLSLIVFSLTHVLPGNVAQMILGPYASPETQAALEDQLGLNQPFFVQYGDWLGNFVQGDWGQSLRLSQGVRHILLMRLLNSAYLAIAALIGVVIFGIGLGILAGIRQNTMVDQAISILALISISIPSFVAGSLFIIFFAGGLWHIFPSSGYKSPTQDFGGWLLRLILPTVTLMFIMLAYVLRMTRSGIIDVMATNYIRTARLKGASERVVVLRHALRNALLPTVTVISMNIGFMIGSAVIIEQIFAYPGLGSLVLFSVNNRDLPLLQANVMVIGIVVGLSNLAADVIYAYLNPRIRYR